jgi:hypothetical protein
VNRVLVASGEQDWETPPEFFAPIHKEMRFTIDVCAHKRNAKLKQWWGIEDNALARSWAGHTWWMNPEYNDLWSWTGKARREAIVSRGVALLPMRPDAWWHVNVLGPAGKLKGSWYCADSQWFWLAWERMTIGIHHVPFRIPFIRPGKPRTGAPFPSVLVYFGPRAERPRKPSRRQWPLDGLAPITWGMPS